MKKILFLASTLLLLTTLFSCSDEKSDAAAQLAAPVITISEKTSSSITFEWASVEGAHQYGYRVLDPSGDILDADVTKTRSVELDSLTPFTTYRIAVTAFPTNVGKAKASETQLDVSTLFYDVVENSEASYVSHLSANSATVTNRGTINEDRSGEDYEENTYGIFTITKFCQRAGYDLVFKVNRDRTISILNNQGYDEQGWAKVATGQSQNFGFDIIYIDESSTVFDGPAHTLTFAARNNGTAEKLRESNTETITWK